jgi:invasion protein IalB
MRAAFDSSEGSMHLISATAAAILLCASAAAQAGDQATPSPAANETPAQPEKPTKVCHMERATGSVMPKRVCRSQEQIVAQQRATESLRQQAESSRGGL